MTTTKGFKVTDSDRKTRVGIAVKNLEELKKKTIDKFKLKFSPGQIDFQTTDGTVIENEEYFQTLPPQTLLIWVKAGEKAATDAEILYKIIREVNEEYLTAGEKVHEFFTEQMKNKVFKLAEVLKGLDADKGKLSTKAEHPEWFEGISTNAKTKEDYMFKRAQDRIRSYYYKTKDELRNKRDVPQNAAHVLFLELEAKLKLNKYHGCYFNRANSRNVDDMKSICDREGTFQCQGRMVRKYKRKRNNPQIKEDDLNKAVSAILEQGISIRLAAVDYNIRKSTLYDRVKKIRENGFINNEGLSRYVTRQIFSANEENELEKYLKTCSKILYGLTYEGTRKLAFEYSKKLEKKYPSSWDKNNIAGLDWMRGFMKRHPALSYRKPENTSMARASCFNPTNVDMFFKNYSEVQTKHQFLPSNIYNVDETGITTVLQAPRVIGEKGTKGVGQCVSGERGTLVTMCGIISASGNSIPPVYIFPRVRMKEQYMIGAVSQAIGFPSKTGWMTAHIFLNVLEHIKKYTKSNATDNHILLLMDNHETHVSLEAIEFCRKNGIVLLSFPPHCTHRMQPLDKCVFGPFKTRCKQSFNDFILSNPGKPVTIYDIARLTADPYLQSFTPKNIVSGFKTTGTWPINRCIYTEDDFIPASTTDHPFSINVKKAESFTNTEAEKTVSSTNIEAEKLESFSKTEALCTVSNILNELIENATKKTINILSVITVKPSDVRPYPKAPARKTKNPSKLGKSRVYTITPEKNRIEEIEKLRRKKLDKKLNIKRKVLSDDPVVLTKTKKNETDKSENKKNKFRKRSKDLERNAKKNKRKKISKKTKAYESSTSGSDVELPLGSKFSSNFSKSDSDLDYECFSDKDELEQLLNDDKIVVDDFMLIKFSTKKKDRLLRRPGSRGLMCQ